MNNEDIPVLTVEELQQRLDQTKAELLADIEVHVERLTIQSVNRDDGKSTNQRAIEALQRPERFQGEHDVARAWLREQAPHLGIFKSYE